MEHQAAAVAAHYRTIKLPAIGFAVPHLGGTFWGIQASKPGTGPDYALIVPEGAAFERVCAWGSAGRDEPSAACMWDGQANTKALVESGHAHPAAEFCAGLEAAGFKDLYLPSLRELKTLFANGCDAFSKDGWYWSSTQFSRNVAYLQDFDGGDTYYDSKSWEGGRARAVRRCALESLIA